MFTEPWSWTREFTVPSRTGAGHQVLEQVLDQLREHGWIEHDVFGVHLAMEEALTNAIRHGNQFDDSKNVQVRCQLSTDFLSVSIVDEGPGFDPSKVPDPTSPDHLDVPSGRGIMLMRSFMTRVEYNSVGNRVTLEKQRDKST